MRGVGDLSADFVPNVGDWKIVMRHELHELHELTPIKQERTEKTVEIRSASPFSQFSPVQGIRENSCNSCKLRAFSAIELIGVLSAIVIIGGLFAGFFLTAPPPGQKESQLQRALGFVDTPPGESAVGLTWAAGQIVSNHNAMQKNIQQLGSEYGLGLEGR
jgi:hypothetical protein